MIWCKRWLAAVTSVFFSSILLTIAFAPAVRAEADLGISRLADNMDPVAGGVDYSYSLSLFNFGDRPAEKTRLLLPLPKTVKFIFVSPAKQCAHNEAVGRIECDFGTLKAGEDKAASVKVTVRPNNESVRSVTLNAKVSTSSVELVTRNNQQSETTTFAADKSTGDDLGIARLEEIVSARGAKIRSFEIVVKNFGATRQDNAKLVISVPPLLKYKASAPIEQCKYDKKNSQLICNIAVLEPVSKGGEMRVFRLDLRDQAIAANAVKIKAIIIASGDDGVVANDIQELVVTVGPGTVFPGLLASNDYVDDAPENTAAIPEDGTDGAGDGSGSGNSDGAGGDSSSGSDGSSSAPGNNPGSPFSGDGDGPQAAPGSVDFQISSFETDPVIVAAGGLFDFTAKLVNNGPDAAVNATADFVLPVGLDYDSTVSGATCGYTSGTRTIDCAIGTLTDGAIVDVVVKLKAAVPGETTRSIAVAIASETSDTNPANNTQNVGITIVKGTDLRLAITGAPNPATAGGFVTYSVTVDNIGLNIAEGASVIFNMPPGMDYVSSGSGGSGWSCSGPGPAVSCSSGADIAALTGTVTFSVRGKVSGGPGSGTYTASGSVTSTTTIDVDGNNDPATHDLTVQPGTDLSVIKSVSDNPMRGGTTSSFTIRVTNNGPIAAQNLVLTDTLPANFTNISASGTGWSCPAPVGQLITCTRPTLAVGFSDVVISVTAPDNVDIPEAGTTVINSASISSDTNDVVSSNDSGSVSFSLQRNGADLRVTMTRSPQPVAQGSNMTNSVVVRNLGPLIATGNIRATYLLAGGGTDESYQSFSGSGWSFLSNTGGLVTFERAGPLAVNANASTLSIVTTATGTGTLTGRACTSSGTNASTHTGAEPVEGDPIRSNNCVSVGLTSTGAIADVVVLKSVSPGTLVATSDTLTYTLTVRNDGPDLAQNVRLTDVIEAYRSAYDDRPATTIVATPSQGSCSGTSTQTCNLGDIAVGAGNAATVSIAVTRPMRDGTINNTASAFSLATGDSNRNNNTASINVTIDPVADIKLRSAVWSPSTVKAGVEATYVLTLRNNGPSTAQAVKFESQFTGDFTFVSATGATCTFGIAVANRLDCSFGNMNFANQRTVTVKLRPNYQAAPAVPRILTNTTTVSTSTQESNLVNNDGGTDLTVTAAEIDLLVTETDEVDPVGYTPTPSGTDNRIIYRIGVTNRGPSFATGVNFTDKFTPPGTHRLRFLCDMSTNAGNCSSGDAGQICTGQGTTATGPAQASVNCTIGDMAIDATYTRYLVYEVLDQPVGGGETFEKEVDVTANEPETLIANNTAEEQTTVRVRTDVAVACAAPPASISLREPFNMQLTVSNNGPGHSQVTTLNQSLPSGMVLTGTPSPASGGSCTGASGGTSYSCALGTVNNGASNVVTIPVRFASFPSGGTYTTSASVTTNEVDTNSGNNSCATATATVSRASIAGYVYEDDNDDGDLDSGETPIQGVLIRITGTDAYGNSVNTTATTNSSGYYRIYNRSPSDGTGYTLTQTPPTGYQDGQENAGGSSVVAGSHTTDVISAIALAAGEDKTHYDFGELPTDIEVVSKTPAVATISLLQHIDFTIEVRNNGPADALNSQLFDSLPTGMELTGAPTTTVGTCSGVTGGTSLTCDLGTLANGAGATITVPVMVTVFPATGTLRNTATASTDNVEITTANNSNFGDVTIVKSSIACVVYQDFNDDGDKDTGEPGIGSVPMSLTGIDAFGNAVNLTQNTLSDGSCLFDNLSPSNAAGYRLSETVQPAGFIDGQENQEGTIISGSASTDVIAPIVLPADTYLQTNQFGEVPPTGVSGTAWCDDNNNGVIDGSEPRRIESVTVTLTGTLLNSSTVNLTRTTNASGYYHFGDLSPGTYTLTQTQNTAHACSLPGRAAAGSGASTAGTADNGFASADFGNVISGIVLAANDVGVSYNFGELEPASIAGVVFNDTDRDDTRDTGEPGIPNVTMTLTCTDYRDRAITPRVTQTLADGSYSYTGLLPSDATGCTITETHPTDYDDGAEIAGNLGGDDSVDNIISAIIIPSGGVGTDYDFGELSAGLTGHVYVDSDDDGVFDSGEQPIAGVPIELSGTDSTGAAVLRSTVTDATGTYLFTGLKPSNPAGYTVTETAQPAAWSDGKDTAGSKSGTVVNDEISAIVLLASDFATDYDFGEIGGSLSGTVYTDLDDDGQQDGTESGIPGVTLNLTCVDVNDQAVARTTVTAGDGTYSFKDLPATSSLGCAIAETQPPNTSDGKDRVGTLGGTLGNDNLTLIPLAPGEDGFGYDFGEVLTNPARISGHVWHDGNHDRANNDGSPQSGWTVELIDRATPSDCQSAHTVVATQTTNASGAYAFEGVSPGTYGVRFRSPDGGYLYAGAQSGDSTGAAIPCGIGSIVVTAGADIVNQDLPLDPSGVVYDSLTRNPVPGATVTISGPAGFNPATQLVGGTPNVTQTTGSTGYYQFLLYTGAPAGDYTLSVGQPAGYIPLDSAIIPVCANTLSVSQTPTPALVQSADTAPPLSAATHNPASCPTTSAGLAGGAGSTQYFFTFTLNPGLPSANVVNNHIPLDPVTEGAFTVAKTTPKVNVSVGQLVPYTITVSNNLAANLPNMEIEDQIPPGFKYKRGSASLDGVRTEPTIDGRQLTWPGLTFNANQKRTIRLLMIVGAGVSEGDYINRAWAENGFIQALASNIATAKVRVTADPTFDCAGVIGKVFDDKNRNGYQDKGEMGLANVRLATVRGLLVRTDKYGRYHVACADVPNPDRGSTFIMKLDHRTLPTGYRLTTENPRAIRLTRGKIGKLNFGVAIHRVVRLDITRDAFTARGNDLKQTWKGGISRLVSVLDTGPSILRIAYARSPKEDRRSVRKRINIIKKQVTRLWRRKRRRVLVIETESYLSAQGSFK